VMGLAVGQSAAWALMELRLTAQQAASRARRRFEQRMGCLHFQMIDIGTLKH